LLQSSEAFSLFGYERAFIAYETSVVEAAIRLVPVVTSLVFVCRADLITKFIVERKANDRVQPTAESGG
jgi:hypothetical protein